MANKNNKSWQLEDFIDSLVYELDKARETLSIKGLSSPLTYAVKDVSMELHVFPEYNGKDVRFVTAGSGESGSSKISLSLGSITDRQIRETAKKPIEADDIALDEIEDIDPETKLQLNRMGIRSAKEVEKIQNQNIKVTKPGTSSEGTGSSIDFKKLAGLINKAQRGQNPPKVFAAQLATVQGKNVLAIKGENLVIKDSDQLKALLNSKEAKVIQAGANQIVLELAELPSKKDNQLIVRLDEHTVFNLNVTAKPK
jgi:hypothetical protein